MEIQDFQFADFTTETSICQLDSPNLISGDCETDRFHIPCQSLVHRWRGHRVITRFSMPSHLKQSGRQRCGRSKMNCDENAHADDPIKNRVKMRLTPSLRGCLC